MNTDYQWFFKCVVCGTPKERGKKNLHFFKFPREIDRCRSWLKAIGLKELIYIHMEDLCELLVCSAHFNMACINEKGSRLHRVGIPSITPFPSLSDKAMAGYPKYRPKPPPVPVTHVFSVSEPASMGEDATNQTNTNAGIDFNLPLMNSLETLIQNEYHTVKKPAAILNTISVPLMTYSSSMEKGTVFGVEDPESSFVLPFVPLNNEPNDMYKPKTTRNMFKTQKITNYKELVLNGKKSKGIKNLTHTLGKNLTHTLGQKHKAIKQYTNRKRFNSVLQKSASLVQNMEQRKTKNTFTGDFNADSITGAVTVDKVIKRDGAFACPNNFNYSNTEIIEYGHKTPKEIACRNTHTQHTSNDNSIITNTTGLIVESSEDDAKPVQIISDYSITSNTDNTSSTDITFVPYSQYKVTVAPESTNAHIGEGTSDYGLPLMNCIGTIFQSNMPTTKTSKILNDQMPIDVPLMQCLKTLEDSNVL